MKAFAAIVAGLICAVSGPAWAAAPAAETATSVKNIYDPLLSNFQETLSNNCATTDCEIIAPAVTKTTLIQHVSCQFSMSSSAVITQAFLTDLTLSGFNYVNPFSYGTVNSDAYRGINADTFLIYKKGMQPRIAIETSGDSAGGTKCTLSGYHQ
jgi:hypothetical protein